MTFVRILFFTILVFCVPESFAKTTKILVMGDSLSAGYGINLEEGWVHLLEKDLAGKTQFINASVSGETTTGGLTRLPALLKTHHPAIIILELGGNDGLRGQPLKVMQDNLQSMIDASRAAGASVLLVGMQIPTNYGPRYTKQFRETFPALAEKNKLVLVPFLLEGVAGNKELIQSDQIHPVASAQPQLARNVKPYLEQMLK
jgi:acyl-CoA thioesterase-1